MTVRIEDFHRRATDWYGSNVRQIRDGQWGDPTPCSEWDVRALVRHLVYENVWVPPLMAGQTIEFRNSDKTDHNIHAMPKSNPEWNESQSPKSPPILKQFNKAEIMVPVKCNQHPWMKMYVNVVASPLFAVSDANGHFEIKGQPPGDYTIAAVQEKLGERTMTLKVAPHEQKNGVDFSFQ